MSSYKPFGLFLLLAGLVLLAACLLQCGLTMAFAARAANAAGTVTDLNYSHAGRGPQYKPVVEFVTADGRRVRLNGAASSTPDYLAGDHVRVLYDPRDPADARIDTLAQMYSPPLFAGAAGTILAVFGAAIIVSERRQRRLRASP